MIDETRARFLIAIATQLDVERVAEVHLFPAIRQGGMESGVAVLALHLLKEPEPEPAAEIEVLAAETTELPEVLDAPEGSDGPYAEASLDETDALEEFDELDGRAAPVAEDVEEDVVEDVVDEPVRRPTPRRFTVFTARYRHTLKGPDRGKWEVSVTEEADAPLLTVDAVVRGVQRRSGEVDEIVRLTGDEMRAVIPVATR